jgi:hypothetical protein
LESEGLSAENIQNAATETEQKAAEMMKTYLGEDPDSSEAIEFPLHSGRRRGNSL